MKVASWCMVLRLWALSFPASTCVLAFATVANADELPFWGDANPATNRTSASSQTVVLASGFESRLCTEADFSLATFDSRPKGATFIIR